MSKRRRFQRQVGVRRYRKLIIIATEGGKTEPQYFSLFNNRESVIRTFCLKGHHDSAPPGVLKRMKNYLKISDLSSTDEAWLVVDKDNWTEGQLDELYRWSAQSDNYGFALSNPGFEYWLLLHFEDGNRIAGSKDCLDRLRAYLPDYKKDIDQRKFTPDIIDAAIERAGQRDNPPCADWPRMVGSTTVYRLVKNIVGIAG